MSESWPVKSIPRTPLTNLNWLMPWLECMRLNTECGSRPSIWPRTHSMSVSLLKKHIMSNQWVPQSIMFGHDASSRLSSPMVPSWAICLATWKGSRKRRWWLKVSCTPAFSHAATIRCASPQVGAMGFSLWMAFTPDLAQSVTILQWLSGQVQTDTMSSSASLSIFLWSVYRAWTPCFLPNPAAFSSLMSAMATSSQRGSTAYAFACPCPMPEKPPSRRLLPAPMIPAR